MLRLRVGDAPSDRKIRATPVSVRSKDEKDRTSLSWRGSNGATRRDSGLYRVRRTSPLSSGSMVHIWEGWWGLHGYTTSDVKAPKAGRED